MSAQNALNVRLKGKKTVTESEDRLINILIESINDLKSAINKLSDILIDIKTYIEPNE